MSSQDRKQSQLFLGGCFLDLLQRTSLFTQVGKVQELALQPHKEQEDKQKTKKRKFIV